MKAELWPLKVLAGTAALAIGAIDMTVAPEATSPAILMLLGLMLLAEGLFDRRSRPRPTFNEEAPPPLSDPPPRTVRRQNSNIDTRTHEERIRDVERIIAKCEAALADPASSETIRASAGRVKDGATHLLQRYRSRAERDRGLPAKANATDVVARRTH